MISCLKPWRKKCPALQIYSGFKMIFEKLQEFLTSAIETFPPPNLYPPHDLHPNSPFITALVWRLNKPKVLHPASSKMFKTRTFAFATRPPLQRERKYEKPSGFSCTVQLQEFSMFIAHLRRFVRSEAQNFRRNKMRRLFLVGNQQTLFDPLTFHHHHAWHPDLDR